MLGPMLGLTWPQMGKNVYSSNFFSLRNHVFQFNLEQFLLQFFFVRLGTNFVRERFLFNLIIF